MTTIRTRSFARAGLLGNPSDGYFGKTLSFAFADFGVDLCLTELEFCQSDNLWAFESGGVWTVAAGGGDCFWLVEVVANGIDVVGFDIDVIDGA